MEVGSIATGALEYFFHDKLHGDVPGFNPISSESRSGARFRFMSDLVITRFEGACDRDSIQRDPSIR
jgi:hypothetical protein